MFSAFTEEGETVPLGAVTGTLVKDGDEFRLNLTVNSDLLFESTGMDDEAGGTEDLGFGDLSSFFDISYMATLPGKIGDQRHRSR